MGLLSTGSGPMEPGASGNPPMGQMQMRLNAPGMQPGWPTQMGPGAASIAPGTGTPQMMSGSFGPGTGIMPPPGAMPMATPTVMKNPPKWAALRTIARFYKVIAWVVLIVGILGAIGMQSTIRQYGGAGLLVAVLFIVMALLIFVSIFASAEIIKLFIAIEENTRGNRP